MKIISLGMGVQSTALYYMSSLGELPRCDYAIFADTGKEKTGTHKYLEYLLNWQKENNGIPIVVIKNRNLFTDLLNNVNSDGNRFASIPAYTKNEDGSIGMLRRQCTGEYKLAQVDLYIRQNIYGKAARKRLPKTEVWIGISLDEISRVSSPLEAWKDKIFPYIGYQIDYKEKVTRINYTKSMTRNDIINWYNNNSLPIPPKSACTFCPYTSDEAWLEMKENPDQSDWESACLVDEAIRNSSQKGIKQPIYLHESCIPLRDVKFNRINTLWKGECSGVCHT